MNYALIGVILIVAVAAYFAWKKKKKIEQLFNNDIPEAPKPSCSCEGECHCKKEESTDVQQ